MKLDVLEKWLNGTLIRDRGDVRVATIQTPAVIQTSEEAALDRSPFPLGDLVKPPAIPNRLWVTAAPDLNFSIEPHRTKLVIAFSEEGNSGHYIPLGDFIGCYMTHLIKLQTSDDEQLRQRESKMRKILNNAYVQV